MKLTEVKGDAVYPKGTGTHTKIIAHIVNNRGGWGRGFVLALSKRWPVDLQKRSPEWCYRGASNMELGEIQMVKVEDDTYVCNMCAQKDYRPLKHGNSLLNIPNLNYSSLYECLLRLRAECDRIGTPSIHMPRIGSGLAGGSWPKIEGIINQVFEPTPYYVTVHIPS